MCKPVIKKQPVEIFGQPCHVRTTGLKAEIRQQCCPFINGTCVKPRKSEPSVKVGICSLGYKCLGSVEHQPVIICPQRFKEISMFNSIRNKYLPHWTNIEWISEVNMGVGGSVDYVAITADKRGKIIDFLCIEIQAAGTTGSPYPAVTDIIHKGKFQRESYNYGINWANEFSKTMMQQVYKKGRIVDSWGRKIIFVLQDVGLQYIKTVCDTKKLIRSNAKLPVDFCTFKMVWSDRRSSWMLKFDEIMSTGIEGINLMLGGAPVDHHISEGEFIANIVRKGIADKILDKARYSDHQ